MYTILSASEYYGDVYTCMQVCACIHVCVHDKCARVLLFLKCAIIMLHNAMSKKYVVQECN